MLLRYHRRLGTRFGAYYLMSRERYIYALTGWTVEKREKGWYFTPWANRYNGADWRGPYSSEASVTMMIARQLRKEIVERHGRQLPVRAS